MSELWTEKYFPKTFSEVIGNPEITGKVKIWAELWASGTPQKPLLLYGSPGVGKTCLAILTAKINDWELFEMNASDFRTKDIIDKVAGAAAQGATFSGKKRLILLDEGDGLQARDRGSAAALLDLQTLSMNQKEITMTDVQSLGYRERKENIFKIMKSIFKGTDIKEIRKNTFQSSVSGDLLFAWIEENIPRQYTKEDDVARAFASLSRADIFNGRIYRRQYWGYKRYSSDLMSSGVALSKENTYYDFVMYTFPTLLRKLSSSRALRAMKKELGTKIGKKIHTSSRQVMAYDLPYLKMFFENKELAAQYTANFELNEKELAFLMNTKPTTKKVQKIIAEAEEIRTKDFTERRIALSGISDKELAKITPKIEEPEEEIEEKPEQIETDEKQTKLF